MQPAVLERPREWTELSQLTFEVIAGDFSRPGNQPANYTLVKGRREALLVDVPFDRADAHRLIARILDTGLKLRTILITRSRPDHVSSLDLLTDVFPDAAVVAHSAVAADIKRLMPLNSDRRAEGIGDNATRCSIIPGPLCTDHIRLEGHKLEILGPVQGGHVHATALWDPRTGTLIAGGLVYNSVFVFLGEHRQEQYDAWLDSLDYLESLSPKRVIAGRSKPGLPEGASALGWTRRYINDFRTFAKMAKSAAEMTEMLRVRNPNAIGFPASDGLFEMSTEVATGEDRAGRMNDKKPGRPRSSLHGSREDYHEQQVSPDS
jgi:glyoxylase-like metal-dependent hydrolase (beta-lactamase superfamily II)